MKNAKNAMQNWIENNSLKLIKLYKKKHTSLTNKTSTPSKSIPFLEWAEYAYHFREDHPDFKNMLIPLKKKKYKKLIYLIIIKITK